MMIATGLASQVEGTSRARAGLHASVGPYIGPGPPYQAPAGSITKKAERATGSQQIARPRVAERTRNIQCRAERAAGSQQMARPEVAEAPAQADEAATQNGLLAAYDRLARERPLLVNSLTALVGVSLGDIIAQLGSGATLDTFDIARWLRMSSFGLLLGGPACYKFYEWIDATVYPDRRQENGVVVLKMTIDQLLWSPAFTCVFFTYIQAVQGNILGAPAVIGDRLVPTMLANWLLWPAAHLINFKYVPPSMRILYVMAVNIIWNTFLSLISNQPQVLDFLFGRFGISLV